MKYKRVEGIGLVPLSWGGVMPGMPDTIYISGIEATMGGDLDGPVHPGLVGSAEPNRHAQVPVVKGPGGFWETKPFRGKK